jgi:hypothetical protein
MSLLHYFAPVLAARLGSTDASRFELTAAGNLASWVEAITLLIASVTCGLVYSIRRHRIDDIRGRYRIWLAASAACLVMSADSVAASHQDVAHALGYVTGWTALRGDAIWWLLVGGVPLTWIAVRAVYDAFECRFAATLLAGAFLCYAAGAVAHFDFLPGLDSRIETMVTGASTLAGHWLLMLGILSYARFVILDAQGLIAARPAVVRRKKAPAAETENNRAESKPTVAEPPTVLSAVGYSRRQQSASSPPLKSRASSQWVDGSRPERDPFEDDVEEESSEDDRKITKSERKRLRKLKTQNRAA